MQFSDHVIHKIAQAPAISDPWLHIPVTDIFPAAFYAEILSNLPQPSKMRPLSRMTQMRHILQLHDKRGDVRAPRFWADLRDELLPKLRAVLENRFGITGKSMASAVVYDEPGYELPPHTDMPPRLITAVFYLPADASSEGEGTQILRGSEPDPDGQDQAFDERFETVSMVPYLPNSALFFKRTDWSYHAVRKTSAPRWTFSFDVIG